MTSGLIVLDTNIVLDLFVFDDPGVRELQRHIETGALRWLATQAMREELLRVLGYPKIAQRLTGAGVEALTVLDAFDRLALLVEPASSAGPLCADADDQHFIDLAVAHCALLFSKDRAITSLRRGLQALGVRVCVSAEDIDADWLPPGAALCCAATASIPAAGLTGPAPDGPRSRN